MSYSNWLISERSGMSITATDKAAIYPAAVSKPEASAGNYARRILGNTFGASPVGICFVSSSYQAGSFVDVPLTKAIRLQGMMQLACCAMAIGPGGIFLESKMSAIPGAQQGYGFGIKRAGANAILAFQTGISVNSSPYYHTFFESASYGTWYNLRMEVYPVGSSADVIKCYKENTIGSNNWQQLGSDIVISSTTGHYIPWGGSSERGNGFLAVGDDIGSNQLYIDAYVDKLSVSIANTGSA
jgi:hypothetical protein